jgi:hypothetical protein
MGVYNDSVRPVYTHRLSIVVQRRGFQRHFFLTGIFANLEHLPRADHLDGVIDTWRPEVIVPEVAESSG